MLKYKKTFKDIFVAYLMIFKNSLFVNYTKPHSGAPETGGRGEFFSDCFCKL